MRIIRQGRIWLRYVCLLFPLMWSFSSCRTSNAYRQNIMFRVGPGDTTQLRKAVNKAEQAYRIQPNDYLEVRVYTNKGERILDPNGELQLGNGGGGVPSSSSSSRIPQFSSRMGGGGGTTGQMPSPNDFLVQKNGEVRLPMAGSVVLGGLTLLQADSLLQILYTPFYKEVFVTTRVTNNRVIVLGSPGGVVVPLYNENMNLLEILAYVGGVGGGGGAGGVGGYQIGRANRIRLIRGDLKNPQVEVIDLTTIAGMRRANLQIEPNDVIYIEPLRQPFLEAFRDVSPFVGTILGLVTTTILILRTF